jgi:hypothetical protein
VVVVHGSSVTVVVVCPQSGGELIAPRTQLVLVVSPSTVPQKSGYRQKQPGGVVVVVGSPVVVVVVSVVVVVGHGPHGPSAVVVVVGSTVVVVVVLVGSLVVVVVGSVHSLAQRDHSNVSAFHSQVHCPPQGGGVVVVDEVVVVVASSPTGPMTGETISHNPLSLPFCTK